MPTPNPADDADHPRRHGLNTNMPLTWDWVWSPNGLHGGGFTYTTFGRHALAAAPGPAARQEALSDLLDGG